MPSTHGGTLFDAQALESLWKEPTPRLALLWGGARALGLHPWHPGVLNRTEHQLTWAILQTKREQKEDPLESREKLRRARLEEAALELIVWADEHVTQWRGGA